MYINKQRLFLMFLGFLFLNSGCTISEYRDSNRQKISNRDWPEVDSMVLSTSGRYLAVSDAGDKNFGSIYSIDLLTNEITLIADTEPFQGMLYVGDYSKDDSELLIWALGGPEYKAGIWLFHIPDLGEPDFISEKSRPKWTLTGDIITVYVKSGVVSIHKYERASGNESILYSAEAVTIKGYTLSPDENNIIFSQKSLIDNNGDILIVDLETGIVNEILLNGDNFNPKWSPVGNYFIYQNWEDGLFQIRIHDLDQDCDISLDNLNQNALNPIWNSDGTGLLFIRSGNVYSYDLSSIFGSGDPKNWHMCH